MGDAAVSTSGAMQRFGRYPEYRDSGVEWLGEIPAHWEVGRLKKTISECRNGVWGEDPDGTNDVACIRVADFDRDTFTVNPSSLTLRHVDPRALSTHRLGQGNLLLEKSGGGERQPVGAVVIFADDLPAVCSNFIARMPVNDGHNPVFLVYLHASLYSSRINVRSIKQSIGIQNLDSESYLNELVGLPPFNEQHEIAEFLHRETARGDALVAKQKELIRLLQEKRTALISQAVTKGLDPDVAMKDSGVEWMGEIPAHWEVKRTKFAATLRSGHTPSRQKPEYWKGCTIPWFGLADVWQIRDGHVEYVRETAEKISEIGLANSSARLLPEGTVILSRTASVGFSAILGVDMATTQDFVNWVCGPSLRPEYLLCVFRAMSPEFRRLTMGSTHQTIYMHDVASFSTPVPPITEQDQIVAFVRRETAKIDAMIAKVIDAIAHLNEYRTALISAAVTGKIDVRHSLEPTTTPNPTTSHPTP
ncbi:MAG: restriction endonuclease subunit S [Gemmatimonadetes bacterium]|nr:restriction endonuclease subunit S [Gemmatimonadota bacterium]